MPKYASYESFRVWLSGELAQREWSHADLARRSNITRSHISRILSGERPPGTNALVAIAHALHLPEEEVLRHAGKISTQRDAVEGQAELVGYYGEMTAANRRRLIQIARVLASEDADDLERP